MVESIEQEYNTARSHVRTSAAERSTGKRPKRTTWPKSWCSTTSSQHDAESNKQLYDGLLQKLKEAGITAGLRSSNIRVVDPALAPHPSRPQKARNIMLCVPGGARRRNWAGDFPRISRQHREVARRHRGAHRAAFAGRGAFAAGLERTSRPTGAAWTARTLRRKLQLARAWKCFPTCSRSRKSRRHFARCVLRCLLSQADHPPQVILVTSALPREGKTTAAVNLAVTLAQLGDRTLLMDSDLRKPGVRRALESDGRKRSGPELLSRRRFDSRRSIAFRIRRSAICRR